MYRCVIYMSDGRIERLRRYICTKYIFKEKLANIFHTHGVQNDFSGQFFRIFENTIFWFVVAIMRPRAGCGGFV